MDLEVLKKAIEHENYRVSAHAINEARNDGLEIKNILDSLQVSEIIENYPESKPLPCYLILSYVRNELPIHTVWAYDRISRKCVLVTVYKPDPIKWVEFKKRR